MNFHSSYGPIWFTWNPKNSHKTLYFEKTGPFQLRLLQGILYTYIDYDHVKVINFSKLKAPHFIFIS